MSRQSKVTYRRLVRNRKRGIERRLQRRQYEDQPRAVMTAVNIHYEMGEKAQGISCGGIGAIHLMVGRVGLAERAVHACRIMNSQTPSYVNLWV